MLELWLYLTIIYNLTLNSRIFIMNIHIKMCINMRIVRIKSTLL